MPTYDYPTAFKSWDKREYNAIERVIKSDWLTMGPETEAFEHELAAHQQRKHAIAVNSGSSANLIAVAAMHAASGVTTATAVVPALAWATTYAPLIQHRMHLRLMDCNETWNAQTGPTGERGLLVGCSILGIPACLADLQDQAKNNNVYFLNDNCESIGATHNGKPTGAYGDVATCSFFHSHQLSAIEGGAVLTDDDELARLCRVLRDHGMTRSVEKAERFEDEYKFVAFGYNVRPAEINMAVAREQLRKLEGFRQARIRNWHHFSGLATKNGGLPIRLPHMPPFEGSPFGIHFTCETQEARSKLAAALRSNGIDCRLPTGGSFSKHEYGKMWRDQSTPNADRIHDTGMFIGNAPFDISDKIERAARVIKEVL